MKIYNSSLLLFKLAGKRSRCLEPLLLSKYLPKQVTCWRFKAENVFSPTFDPFLTQKYLEVSAVKMLNDTVFDIPKKSTITHQIFTNALTKEWP